MWPLRRGLILEEDGRRANGLVALDDADDVLHVAVSVVAVHEHRQVCRADHLAHAIHLLAVMLEVDVGMGIARSDKGEAADLECLEARQIDQPRGQCVMRRRELQQTSFIVGLPPRSALCSHRKGCHPQSPPAFQGERGPGELISEG
jgi:hypothetical protein